jgi:hypothetical protein
MAETKALRMKISGVLLLLLATVPAHPQFKLAIFSPSLDYAMQLKEAGADFTGIFADLNLFEVGFPAIPLSKGYNPGYHYLGCAVLKLEVAKDIFVLSPLQFVMTFTLWSRGLQSCMAAVSLGLLNAGFHLAGDPSAFYAPELDIRAGLLLRRVFHAYRREIHGRESRPVPRLGECADLRRGYRDDRPRALRMADVGVGGPVTMKFFIRFTSLTKLAHSPALGRHFNSSIVFYNKSFSFTLNSSFDRILKLESGDDFV